MQTGANQASSLVVCFATGVGSWDAFPRSHERPWAELAERSTVHRPGDKDGPWVCGGMFSGPDRKAKNLIGRGVVALDIETNKETGEVPPPFDVVVERLRSLNQAAVVWTTYNHLVELPRYRVLMPLSAPLPIKGEEREQLAIDRCRPLVVAHCLKLAGVTDMGKCGASSIFFTARHAEGRPHLSKIVEGDPVDAETLDALALMTHFRDRMSDEQKARLDATTRGLDPAVQATIDQFNETHATADLFARYGYVRAGTRWRSPHQHPGSQAATEILPDGQRWFSFSESDKSAGIGQACDKGVWGSAFDLWKHFECGNDFRAALEKARAIARDPPRTSEV